MPGPEHSMLRRAGPEDAAGVARLHADSWRRHYRGVYSDAFLDGDVDSDRLAVWSERLARAGADATTIIAERAGAPVGFVHVIFDADRRRGALVDNLHVAARRQREGLGTLLLARAGADVAARRSRAGLYLWVLELNTSAQAFYRARGGRCVERAPVPPPGAVAERLVGTPLRLCYVWAEASALGRYV